MSLDEMPPFGDDVIEDWGRTANDPAAAVLDADSALDDTVALLARARAEGVAGMLVGEPRCRICGCTEITPCPDGCGWVAPDLCSSCA